MGRVRATAGTCRDIVVNQMLGLAIVRSLTDRASRRPALGPQKADGGDIWDDPFNPELPLRKWRKLLPHLGGREGVRGRVILEIGPGMSLGMGVVGVALGARRCVLADSGRYVTSDPRIVESHRRLLALLPAWFPDPDPVHTACVRIAGDAVVPDGDRLHYRIAPVERLDLPGGSVDITLSHSVLEHVRAMDAAAAEIARVMTPQGVGLHQIDLADHIHEGEPLRMLEVSGRLWDLMADHRRGWTNRLRLPAFIDCFARAGLHATGVHVSESLELDHLATLRPLLHPEFRNLPDAALTPLTALLVLRRR